MKVYFDTNVLLDILMESRQNHVDSATILQVAAKGKIELVISAQSIIDASYVFSQKEKLPQEGFNDAIRYIVSVATIVAIDDYCIKCALRSDSSDFEDAAQVACASRAECDIVVSSDKKIKHFSSIPVYTPGEFCNLLFGIKEDVPSLVGPEAVFGD